MKERWVLMTKSADFQKFGEKYHIDPVIARVIRNRDVQGEAAVDQYLQGTMEMLPDPRLLKGMTEALDIIQEGIRAGHRFRIIGDYDIDGVMSTYILLDGLRRMGAQVDTCIPDRVQDGYGIHEELVRRAAEDRIDIILTCDNGIAAAEEIALARELGLAVVVTDHHNIPYDDVDGVRKPILPPADAVVNPKQEGCPYPFKELCGAAVAYKVIQALYERYGKKKEEYEKYLELAALATVGDVMDLQGENRILVKEGLKRLKNPCNTGIRALIHATKLDPSAISAYHLGFVLGPCINASGRLNTAVRSLELLEAEDEQEAARLAGDLYNINESRKGMTQEGLEEAISLVETTSLKDDPVLVVYLPQCHESLAGIIAGRLRERYYKPALVLTRSKDQVKGSGRSIDDYSMFDELNRCKELMIRFGGHPMAAGLSLEEKNVPILRRRLNELCTLTKEQLAPKVSIDAAMPLSYVTEKLVEQMSLLEPFGKGNSRPLFAQRQVGIRNTSVKGRNRNVVLLSVRDGIRELPGVYFGDGDVFLDYIRQHERIDITYYPEINVWNGRKSLRIIIKNYR